MSCPTKLSFSHRVLSIEYFYALCPEEATPGAFLLPPPLSQLRPKFDFAAVILPIYPQQY